MSLLQARLITQHMRMQQVPGVVQAFPLCLHQCNLAVSRVDISERAMGIEPTAFSLARRRSTDELRPQCTVIILKIVSKSNRGFLKGYCTISSICDHYLLGAISYMVEEFLIKKSDFIKQCCKFEIRIQPM